MNTNSILNSQVKNAEQITAAFIEAFTVMDAEEKQRHQCPFIGAKDLLQLLMSTDEDSPSETVRSSNLNPNAAEFVPSSSDEGASSSEDDEWWSDIESSLNQKMSVADLIAKYWSIHNEIIRVHKKMKRSSKNIDE